MPVDLFNPGRKTRVSRDGVLTGEASVALYLYDPAISG
jgi:hypothetical protein